MREELDLTFGEIAAACGGVLLGGSADARAGHITTDSRMAQKGDFFVALRGEKFDGHDFVPELASKKEIGAYLAVSNIEGVNIPCVKCGDTLGALGKIASFHRAKMNATLIAVTGTNGKTTTKEILSSIFSAKGETIKSEKNYNNEIGMPFTLFAMRPRHKYAIIEMGMNHPGEISRLTSYARPDAALITNAGEGHLEYLGSVENVARAKSEIMESMAPSSPVFLNADGDCFEIMRAAADERKLKVVTFGLKDADYTPSSYKLSAESLSLVLRGEEYSLPMYGVHNLYNLLSALAVALCFGISPDEIRKSLSGFENVGRRSEIVECGYTVINDTYNSNPLSLRAALSSIGGIYPSRRKIAVIGDMKELGEMADHYHREAAREALESGFSAVFAYGDKALLLANRALELGMSGENARHFTDKNEMKVFLQGFVSPGDVVLVKGSRSMKMEEIAEALIRKQN